MALPKATFAGEQVLSSSLEEVPQAVFLDAIDLRIDCESEDAKGSLPPPLISPHHLFLSRHPITPAVPLMPPHNPRPPSGALVLIATCENTPPGPVLCTPAARARAGWLAMSCVVRSGTKRTCAYQG